MTAPLTPLESAEKAVAEARRDVHEYFVLLAPANAEPARGTVARLEAAVHLHDTELARAEHLHDNTGTPEDEAYNQGVDDAANAIAAHSAREQA